MLEVSLQLIYSVLHDQCDCHRMAPSAIPACAAGNDLPLEVHLCCDTPTAAATPLHPCYHALHFGGVNEVQAAAERVVQLLERLLLGVLLCAREQSGRRQRHERGGGSIVRGSNRKAAAAPLIDATARQLAARTGGGLAAGGSCCTPRMRSGAPTSPGHGAQTCDGHLQIAGAELACLERHGGDRASSW